MCKIAVVPGRKMEKFRIRPYADGAKPLVELCGDHRAANYPNVRSLLAVALGATQQQHPVFSAETMIATDRYFSHWSYEHGLYEIDDDKWACFLIVQRGGAQVLADLEHALTNSGQFVKAHLSP